MLRYSFLRASRLASGVSATPSSGLRAATAVISQSRGVSHAVSNVTLTDIEKRWESMPPSEQADLWMSLRDRMKGSWGELTVQEKKACRLPFTSPSNWPSIATSLTPLQSLLDRFRTSWPSRSPSPRRDQENHHLHHGGPRRFFRPIRWFPLGSQAATKDPYCGMARGGGCVLEGTKGRAPQWYFEGVLEIQEIFDRWARTRAEEGWGFVDRREALGKGKGTGRGGMEEFQIQYSRKSIVSNHSSQLCEAEIAFGHFFSFFSRYILVILSSPWRPQWTELCKKKAPKDYGARGEEVMFFAQIAGVVFWVVKIFWANLLPG